MAKKEKNETLKKLNESFGQYDSSTNIDMEYSISPNSEDDKPQTGKPDLSLKDDGIGNNDSPIQDPAKKPTAAQNTFSDKIVEKENEQPSRRMNESFGQYDSSTNIDTEYSISANSEDDKPQTGKPDLSLKDDGIGNNDSPIQDPADAVTPEQQIISDSILAQEEKIQAVSKKAKKEVKDMQKDVESYIDEVEKEYNEAGGLKGLAQEKAEDLKKAMNEDPKGTLCDLGKKTLMVVGAFALLKALFRK